ncbi:MAG: thiamine biosynthesis protein [Candidatus Kaiserbacteria bacterium]|nr:thiamine biosynthesis protein [Candidatus Kaiserbacteria bacterium]
MRETRDIMGMPVSVEIVGRDVEASAEKAFAAFVDADQRFSTYKTDSEISRINRDEIAPAQYSEEMKAVCALAEETKQLTHGYFDIRKPDGSIDPSGIVKGWAINNVARLLRSLGHADFYVEAGGDIQTAGTDNGEEWSIGVRNPFKYEEIVKVVYPRGRGIATSGTAIRGAHIYDPHTGRPVHTNIASITVIGPDVYEADRFATAAFAMGEKGINFIEQLEGFEAYQIDTGGIATMTSGFETYL